MIDSNSQLKLPNRITLNHYFLSNVSMKSKNNKRMNKLEESKISNFLVS